MPTPFVLGEEGAGTVTAVGPGCRGVAVGDRVAWCQSPGSESTVVNKPARLVVPVPDGVDLEVAAAAMLQGLTAHYLVTSTYAVRAGDVALVHAAAGGVGQLLVQMVTARGGDRRRDGRHPTRSSRSQGRSAPSTSSTTPTRRRPGRRRARRQPGAGSTSPTTGSARSTFDASLASLRPRGMMVLFGGASGQVPPFDIQRLNSGGSLFLTRPTLAPLRRRARGVRVARRRGARRGRRRVARRSTSAGATRSPRRPRPTRRSRAGGPRASSSWCPAHEPHALPRTTASGPVTPRPLGPTRCSSRTDASSRSAAAAARRRRCGGRRRRPARRARHARPARRPHPHRVARRATCRRSTCARRGRSRRRSSSSGPTPRACPTASGCTAAAGTTTAGPSPVQPDRHALDTVSGDRVAALLERRRPHDLGELPCAATRRHHARHPRPGRRRDRARRATASPPASCASRPRSCSTSSRTSEAPLRPWLERCQELAALGRPHEHHRHRR